MEIDGYLKRREEVKSLADQSTDHSGEDIPCPSGGHSWIACWIDKNLSFGGRDQGGMSFEDEMDMLGLREIFAESNPILQDFFDLGSNQSCHFSRMGGQNEWAILKGKGFRLGGQSGQPIGI